MLSPVLDCIDFETAIEASASAKATFTRLPSVDQQNVGAASRWSF